MQVIPLVKFGSRDGSEQHLNIHARTYYHIQHISTNQRTNPNQQIPLKFTNAHGEMKEKVGQYLRERGRSDSPHSPPKRWIWGGGSEGAGGRRRPLCAGRARTGGRRKGGWGRRGLRGPRTKRLSRQPAWRDRGVHVSCWRVQPLLAPPAWHPCRAACTGATKAASRANYPGAIKRAMDRK